MIFEMTTGWALMPGPPLDMVRPTLPERGRAAPPEGGLEGLRCDYWTPSCSGIPPEFLRRFFHSVPSNGSFVDDRRWHGKESRGNDP